MTRDDMQKLMQAKNDLLERLDKLIEQGASKEDIEAAITAATERPANLSKGE